MHLASELPCTTLASQQRWLYRAITDARDTTQFVRTSVVGGKLAPERRLQIYRHAYVQRLIGSKCSKATAATTSFGTRRKVLP
jgi:hypothetical protein